MSNALVPAPISPATIAARTAALDAYNEAVTGDGICASTWDAIARELASVAVQLTGERAAYLRARSADAIARANYARRMVAVAKHSRRKVIPTVTSAAALLA